MKVYVAVCLDHHQDPVIHVYGTAENANADAKAFAESNAGAFGCPPEYFSEKVANGLYSCHYCEGDSAYVIEQEMNA